MDPLPRDLVPPPGRAPRWLAVALACLWLAPAPARAQHTPPPGERPAIALDRAAGWRADLDTLAARVRRWHPRPFHRCPEARFDSALAAIRAGIATRPDHENAAELMRLVALIEDGHSAAYPTGETPGFSSFIPVRLLPLEDGLFVRATSQELGRFAGARVERVGTLPADEALRRASALVAGDNPYTILDRVPLVLMMPGLLRAIGATADSDRVAFEVRPPSGRRERFVAVAVTPPSADIGWYFDGEGVPAPRPVLMHDAARAPLPLHLRSPERAFWFEYQPAERLLYVQFRRVAPFDAGETFGAFCRRLFAACDSLRPEALVIDLRHNHGGNNTLWRPMIHGLIRRDQDVNRRGRLFTVVGRGTFSAAMNGANWLEEHTNTLFVGEPTGSRPNSYGDAEDMILPHTGMLAFVSRWPWQARLPWDDRPWIAPHLAAPMTSGHYAARRDPALEAIAEYRAGGPAATRLRPAAAGGDSAEVARALATYQERFPDRWGRTLEAEVSRLAYDLLGEGRRADALAVFRANAGRYPESANAWDSLAEGWLAHDRRDLAIACYRRALALDPGFRSAREALRRLGADPGH